MAYLISRHAKRDMGEGIRGVFAKKGKRGFLIGLILKYV